MRAPNASRLRSASDSALNSLDRPADEFAALVAQHEIEGGVGLAQRAVDVDDHDAQRRAFEHRPETRFGPGQRHFGLDALGFAAQVDRAEAGAEHARQDEGRRDGQRDERNAGCHKGPRQIGAGVICR